MDRNSMIRSTLSYGIALVAALWIIWFLAGGGIPWPLLPTVLVAAAAIYMRLRLNEAGDAPAEKTVRDDVQELPRIRFDDDGNPTDSFIRELHQPKDDQ